MRHLWQRIFTYSIILVTVSQLTVFFLYRYSVNRDEVRRFITEYTSSIAASMEDGSVETADALLRVFNRRHSRSWVEDLSGRVIAGAVPPNVRPGKTMRKVPENGLVVTEMEAHADWYIASVPIALRGGGANLFIVFGPPRGPGIWTLFFQGLVFVSVIALLLAFWMARRVSNPLRTLRGEVMEITGGNLESRVTVKGHDEITDVAKAVNHMADNLARHIRGMGELVGNISHEIRSPLARIQVSAAMLEEDVAENPKAASRLALIQEELEHMNRLVGATLLTSKLDLQAAPQPEGAVAFSELCEEVCRRHLPVFTQKNLRFSRIIQEGVMLPGDETLLTTLVSNLLENASKYTHEYGIVLLRLASGTEGVLLEVENEHEPLPEEVLVHLFEPFYRGGIATGNGVGLGLSLVRQIAEIHGGSVTAVNAPDGVRFSVLFPHAGGA